MVLRGAVLVGGLRPFSTVLHTEMIVKNNPAVEKMQGAAGHHVEFMEVNCEVVKKNRGGAFGFADYTYSNVCVL